MPRYEQLKAKSKGISYTRRIRNDDKEFNFKKPIIISISFILLVSILFTVIKKYSPMVDIAVKDFFSINHREALTLETTGSEEENKISFLDNVPLFNFFIKSNTNETLSIMAYETNSMLETSVNTNTTQNNSTITRESLSVFFNNNQNNQLNNTKDIEEQKDNNIENTEEQNINNIVNDSYNYIQEMIQQNRGLNNNNNNNNNIKENNNLENNNLLEKNNYLEKVTNSINNKTSQENKNTNIENNSNISSSIFYDILKPKENSSRDIKTMRPATTTYSSTPPSYMRNNNEPKEKYNTNNYNYYFRGDKKEENNYNSRERVITSDNDLYNNSDDKKDSVQKPPVKNSTQQDYERLANSLVNQNNNITEKRNNTTTIEKTTSKKDLIINSQTSVMPNNNAIIKNNNDYNRVINDLVNPNNTERVINNNERIINNTEKQINNNVVREENKIISTKENINKKEIIQKAQKDIAKYKTSKANNSVKRDYSNERNLKNTNNEGVYLVEYDENTGSITLIFRKRNIENNNSIEDTIKTLLNGATDEENRDNIISCIPKDTELLDIFVEGDTVYLNFNESFEFNPLGNEGTMLQIYQLVYTATQFEGIDNVIFLIDGNLNETIGAEGAIENIPFKRFE